MKSMVGIFILSTLISFSLKAEIFKCKSASGEIIYQSTQCARPEISLGMPKIKEMTPQELKVAEEKLKAQQQEEAAYEAEKAEEEKQRRIEVNRQQTLKQEQRRAQAIQNEANSYRRRMGVTGNFYRPTPP
jgi:hypothetical protein